MSNELPGAYARDGRIAPEDPAAAVEAPANEASTSEGQELADQKDETSSRQPTTTSAYAITSSRRSFEGPGEGGDEVYTPAPKANPVVEALKNAGLYVASLGGGQHSLTCPWASEHAAEPETPATYTEPHSGNPFGRFRCCHAHAEKRRTAGLLDHLGLTLAMARTNPRIRISAGNTYLAVAAAERELAADGAYFHAGGPIVRIVNRPGQGISSEVVNEQTLASVLAAKIDWERKGQSKEWGRCDPPPQVVQGLLKGQDRPHLKTLSGLARQPFYRPDGTLVRLPGFDVETGTYAAFNEADYELRELTRDLAERYLAYLKYHLEEFPFVSDADQSAALAAMLTAAIRPSLPQAPAFSISATGSGSGKSYLASIIAQLAGPDEPYNVSYPTKAEEATKVVQAMLLEKPAVILFDDMQTDWKSFGSLNKALTSPTTTERILGASRTATASTRVLFLGTGNNIEPRKDMRRRVITIRLDPPEENPALRSFQRDPLGDVKTFRARAVEAALTIIGAYRAAGSPKTDLPSIAGYTAWSDLCRQSLCWLGEPDPGVSLIEQIKDDADLELLAEFMDLWHREFGSTAVTVRKLIAKAEFTNGLMDVLAELPVMEGRHINPRKLGWYLKGVRGRRAGGCRIESAECTERRAWRVVVG